MSPIVELLLILVSLVAAVLWVLIYFFLLEGLLKRLVGLIFGVTIGRSRLMERSVMTHTHFFVSGWEIVEPQGSGCLFGTFIWVLGSVLRLIVIGAQSFRTIHRLDFLRPCLRTNWQDLKPFVGAPH